MKKRNYGAVTIVREDNVKVGYEQWQLHIADVHYDSIFCDRDALFEDLNEAKKRKAKIFIWGDLFDAMQGRFDPRRNMDELREEYRREDYYDFVVRDLADALKPYAKNLEIIADGNHELSVLKNANTNLADRLVYALNVENKVNITHGGYGGWVVWMYDISGVNKSIKLKYFHGAGSEAPVTRGVIQTNRQAVYLPDADIVVNGHNHNSYYIPIARERISTQGIQYMDIQHHLRVPGYKQAYGDGAKGWDVTRGGVPKPVGCCWVKHWFAYSDTNVTNKTGQMKIKIEPYVRGGDMMITSPDVMFDGVVFPQDHG